MIDEILMEAEEKMEKSFAVMLQDFANVRTGRANTAILDGVMVTYYGADSPLKQLAGLATPDARTLEIRPYDASSLQDIEKGILKANIGVTPQSDGKVIRLMFPPLTQERRKDLAKVVHKMAEDGRIAVRAIRRDANDKIKKLEKDKAVPEDSAKGGEEEIQKLTDAIVKKIDGQLATKEKELMEI